MSNASAVGATAGAVRSSLVDGGKESGKPKPALDGSVPPSNDAGGYATGSGSLPQLIRPNMEVFDLQALLDAVTMDKGGTLKNATLAALKDKADARNAANAQNLEKFKKNAALLEKKGTLGILSKIFKGVGVVLGIAAAVALACTGGGAFIVAGVITGVLAFHSGLGLIHEDISLKGLLKVCGVSESTAAWVAFTVEIVLTVTACCFAVGGAIALAKGAKAVASVAEGTQAAEKLVKAKSFIKYVTTIGKLVNQTSDSTLKIFSAYNERDISNLKASQKEIDALIKKLTQLMETDSDFFAEVVKRTNELLESVMTIVKENGKSQHKILTSGAQNMA